MNQPWIYMYFPSWSPLPPSSPPDSSGSSQCTRPQHLSHASSLGWCRLTTFLLSKSCCFIASVQLHSIIIKFKFSTRKIFNVLGKYSWPSQSMDPTSTDSTKHWSCTMFMVEVGWICRCRGVRLWDVSFCGFWCPPWVQEPTPWIPRNHCTCYVSKQLEHTVRNGGWRESVEMAKSMWERYLGNSRASPS